VLGFLNKLYTNAISEVRILSGDLLAPFYGGFVNLFSRPEGWAINLNVDSGSGFESYF